VASCALAHDDVAGIVVDDDAYADFGPERFVCHIRSVNLDVDVWDVRRCWCVVGSEVFEYDSFTD